MFRRGPIATFHENRPRQFIQLPQEWHLADAGFAQKYNGPGACAECRIDVDEAGVIGHQHNAFARVSHGLGFWVNVNVQFGPDNPSQQRP